MCWATPTDVTALSDMYIARTKETLTEAGLKGSSAKLLPAGAVLLTSRATIGYTAVAKVPICTNQGFVNFICGPDLVPEYLAYWLRSQKPLLQRLANGVTFKEISRGTVKKLEIELPSRTEQCRVVDLLSSADGIVRMRREAEAKAKEIIPALFLDMFGGESSNPVVKVDDCLASKKGGIRTGPFGSQLLHSEFTSEGIAVLGIDNAVNNRFEWSVRRFISPEKYEQLTRYTVRPGDVLITIMGTCGRCAIVPEGIPVTINTKHLCALTLARDSCLPEYLQGAFLFDPAVRRQLAAATKGAIMAGLNMQIIRNLRVQLPSIDRQASYRAAALQYDEMRRVAETAMHTAGHVFQSLLAGVFGE